MYTFLIILFVLLSITMVVVILLQAGKGQGLAGSIGGGPMGGSALFGGRGAADFLSKSTAWIAALYLILALAIGVIYKSRAENTQQSLIEQRSAEEQAMPAPNIPVAPLEREPVAQPPAEQGDQE